MPRKCWASHFPPCFFAQSQNWVTCSLTSTLMHRKAGCVIQEKWMGLPTTENCYIRGAKWPSGSFPGTSVRAPLAGTEWGGSEPSRTSARPHGGHSWALTWQPIHRTHLRPKSETKLEELMLIEQLKKIAYSVFMIDNLAFLSLGLPSIAAALQVMKTIVPKLPKQSTGRTPPSEAPDSWVSADENRAVSRRRDGGVPVQVIISNCQFSP